MVDTEDADPPGAEVAEDLVAVRRGKAAVEDADVRLRRESRNARRRLARGRDVALPLVDRGDDDVDALSCRDALRGEAVDPLAVGLLAHPRHDRGAARRLFVQHRDVELAIDGPGERARDRRGGHDEDVRRLPLPEEACAVRHPEAVLFVHHHEGETPETDRRFDQGVRADEHVDRPRLQRREELPPRRTAHAPGQQGEADARAAEELREGLRVLFGEDLGRSHQRALGPVAGREQERESRDRGLSAADVALEEPRHRAAGPEVFRDLAHRALLRVRQSKRQRGARCPPQLLVGHQADPGAFPEAGALVLDARRENEQLLAHESSRPGSASAGSAGK